MPAQRPRAKFVPIPHDLDIPQLVESQANFKYVDRIAIEMLEENGPDKLELLIQKHVVNGGKPLVIDGFNHKLDPWTFAPKWLSDNVGGKVEQARDIDKKENIPLTMKHYLSRIGVVANQHFRDNPDAVRQRIYLKDIDCPQVWHDKLQEHIPPFLYYLNDSTGDYGGPGAPVDHDSTIPGRRLGRGIARAGDLMSSLPEEMRAENMMCYIGHEGTYTPTHREMCATIGHNIMVEASGQFGDDGKAEKPGSSIWFMTEAKDRHTASEYWLSVLGHDIETENHFAQIKAWKSAPFTVYVLEQRPGDFVIIPPLAPHQVWNRGTRTMKAAWNRTTVDTLEMAMAEALPKARIVCRDEQYKNKSIVYYTLIKYAGLLASAKKQADKLPLEAGHAMIHKGKIRQLQKDFKRLFALFKTIMLSEMLAPDGPHEKCEYLPFDSNVTCAYCRGNIFNRFLSCPTCKDALGHTDDEPYDVCMECYAMGRSCACISGLKWMEQFKWKELLGRYEGWRKLIIELDGDVNQSTPLTLVEERKRYPKKTLAEVCKEQLKRRPFKDPNKAKDAEDEDVSDEEIIVDDEGRVKKTVKKRSKTWLKNNSRCHVCQYRQPQWKMAQCRRCERWWCYGSLFRGHDDMPLSVMENPDWECSHCQGVCFAGHCRRDPRQNPYQPKGTLLGHDTKKVADARSVEALVDFSVSNLNWIREDENAEESSQMRHAREEAEKSKENAAQINDDDDDEGSLADAAVDETQILFDEPEPDPADELIDPALLDHSTLVRSLSRENRVLPSPTAMMQGVRPGQPRLPVRTNGRDGSIPPEGYAPAKTAGFSAPTANIIPVDGEDGHQYPDPTDAFRSEDDQAPQPRDSNFLPFGKPHGRRGQKQKRRSEGDEQLSMSPAKKRRVTEDVANLMSGRPRNEASKQFEKEKERKALEEARRTGRFISVSAALRGKRLPVTLKIRGARLAQLLARQAARQFVVSAGAAAQADRHEDEPEDSVVLRSDIVPAPKPRPIPKKAVGIPSKLKIRVEKDEDFGARKDRHPRTKTVGPSYEEMDIVSDDEDDFDQIATARTRTDANGKRRVSKYIEAKHQDDPDLPDELPDDYRDSRPWNKNLAEAVDGVEQPPKAVFNKDNKGRLSGSTSKAKPGPPGKRRGRPPKKKQATSGSRIDLTAHADEDEGEEEEVDSEASENEVPVPIPFSSINKPNGTSKAAILPKAISSTTKGKTRHAAEPSTSDIEKEEENRQAKLASLRMFDGAADAIEGEDEEEDDHLSDFMSASPGPNLGSVRGMQAPVAHMTSAAPLARGSIFDRKGPGKKVRIVGAASVRKKAESVSS